MVGASVGTYVLPGPGTAIGGAVLGILGGIAGGVVGGVIGGISGTIVGGMTAGYVGLESSEHLSDTIIDVVNIENLAQEINSEIDKIIEIITKN